MAYFGLFVGIVFLLYLLIVQDIGVYGVRCKKKEDPVVSFIQIMEQKFLFFFICKA